MQLTLTYNDLLTAAQAHINKMGVTGEVVNVDIKVGRKDRTKTTMTITIGTPEANYLPAEVPAETEAADVVSQTEQTEPVEELVEEVFVEDVETETSPEIVEEVVEEVVPRTGLFRGVN